MNENRSPLGVIFRVFLRLGLTSFGGPVAHLGYFREEFVNRRKWMTDRDYADLVALCQFLPGPASSQVGMAVGSARGGTLGAMAAWIGFTMPSALVMIAFGFGALAMGEATSNAGWLHGFKLVAVAVVAQAVWGMAKSLCPDRIRASMALLAALLVIFVPGVWGQIAAIALGGIAGRLILSGEAPTGEAVTLGRRQKLWAQGHLLAFLGLLVALPVLAASTDSQAVRLFDSFYRAGSLVFGGGHVVLPLLQAEVVAPGLVTDELFLAGYGMAQAVPGPLFTFAAYLGAVMKPAPNGILGGMIALLAVFLPSYLLVMGVLPYWRMLVGAAGARSAMMGVNAAVVGLLLAALYHPVWTSAVRTSTDFALALAAFGALTYWKVPPWIVVAAMAVAGAILA